MGRRKKNASQEKTRLRRRGELEKTRRDKEKRGETEEERAARKERERKEKKEREQKEKENQEMMELGDDYFAAEEAKLDSKRKEKEESEEVEKESYEAKFEVDIKEEDGDSNDGIIKMEVQAGESDDEKPLAVRKKNASQEKTRLRRRGE